MTHDECSSLEHIVTVTLVSRSVNSEGMGRFKSSNRYSKDNDVPSNMAEDITLNNLQYKSSSVKITAKEHININIFDTLIDTHDTGEKGICQSCDSASNQTHYCDELSDVIISVDVSSNKEKNSYRTSKAWPKTLKLSRSQCKKIKKASKPTRI
jgi:hypothetical protein